MKSQSVFAAALVLAAAVTAQAQTVKVEFLMGKVNVDAQNVSAGPLATAYLDHRVPFGFHGNWKAA